MERFFNLMVVPQSKYEAALYMVDTFGVVLSIVWMAEIKDSLSLYILILTAVSLTITVGVKIYNLFNGNDKNKKV